MMASSTSGAVPFERYPSTRSSIDVASSSHGRHKGLESQPNDHVGKRYDAVMRVFVPYVTV